MSSEVPEGWLAAKLCDVSRSFAGGTPSRSNPAYYGCGIPWLKSGEVRAGRIVGTEEQITELGLRESSARLVRAGTPVLAMYGGGTVGTVGILSIDAAVNQAVLAIEPDKTRLNGEFCYYLLRSANRRLLSLIQGSGQANLSKAIVDAIEVILPPLDEQRRIAEVLRSVDQHLSLTSQTLAAAQAAKNATLTDALGRDWPETTVGELLANTGHPMRSGPFGSALLKSELVTEGIPFLGIDNVRVEQFVPTYKRFISQEKYHELARYTVFPSDVMVTIMGTVGRCCVVPPEIGTAISSKHVWTLTLDAEKYSPHLLAWQINHAPWVLEQLSGAAQGGIMSAISSGTLRGLIVPLPRAAELREIEQYLLSCNSAISSLEAELASAEKMKAALANDLLSGRVRVPE